MRKTQVKKCRAVAYAQWEKIGRRVPYKRILRQIKKITRARIAKALQATACRDKLIKD